MTRRVLAVHRLLVSHPHVKVWNWRRGLVTVLRCGRETSNDQGGVGMGVGVHAQHRSSVFRRLRVGNDGPR